MHGCWAHQELGAGLPEGCYPPGGVKSALLPLCHEPHRLPEACRSIPQPCVSKAPPFHDGGKTAELKLDTGTIPVSGVWYTYIAPQQTSRAESHILRAPVKQDMT